MKTKSRLFLIVFLMALVMLVGAFAVAPFTASATGSVRVDFCLTNGALENYVFFENDASKYFITQNTKADGTLTSLEELYRTDSLDLEFDGWYTEEGDKVTLETVFTEYTILYDRWKATTLQSEDIISALEIGTPLLEVGETAGTYNASSITLVDDRLSVESVSVYEGLNAYRTNKLENGDVLEEGKSYSLRVELHTKNGELIDDQLISHTTANYGLVANMLYSHDYSGIFTTQWTNREDKIQVIINYDYENYYFTYDLEDKVVENGQSPQYTVYVSNNAKVQGMELFVKNANDTWASLGAVMGEFSIPANSNIVKQYRVEVTFQNGLVISSNTFKVDWYDPNAPKFITQPMDYSVAYGTNVLVTWGLNCDVSSIYLEKSNGETYSQYQNATPTGTTINALESGTYTFRVHATKDGGDIYSDSFTVTWREAFEFTTQPQSHTVATGEEYTITWATNQTPSVLQVYAEQGDGTYARSFNLAETAKEYTFSADMFGYVKNYKLYASYDGVGYFSDVFTRTVIAGEFTKKPDSEINAIVGKDCLVEWDFNFDVEYYNIKVHDGNDYVQFATTDKPEYVFTASEVGYKQFFIQAYNANDEKIGEDYLLFTIKWTEQQIVYLVSFNANGGEGTMASVEQNAGAEYTLPDCDFTAPEYMEFKAWSVNEVEKQVGETITINANTVVKAVWQQQFIVAYAPGEGGGSAEFEYVTTGTTVTLLNPTDAYLGYEAPEGKKFAHWRVCKDNASDPNAVVKNVGEEITITYDTYIIAVWNTIIYSVDINGIIAPVDGEIHDISTITVNTEGILGFSALQWCKSSSNTVLNPGVAFIAGQAYHLNIKFEVAEGYVLNPRSGSPYHADITINAEAPYTSMASNNNFYFRLNYTAANLPVVSFDANGGGGEMTAIPDVKGDYELPACTFTAPTDHYFKAWAIGAIDGPQKKVGETITISSDTTLYAIWGEYTTINTVNITGIIAPVDGEIHDISTITVNTEGILGFSALQWCKSSSNTVLNPGVTFVAGQAYHLNIKFALAEGYRLNTLSNSSIHADITINAEAPFASMTSNNNFFFRLNYTATNPSTVSFDANGGTGSMAPSIDQYGPYELPSCAFTAPSGKQFKAWAIGSLEGEQKAPGEQITVTDDIVIYAIWKDIPVATGITASYNGTILAGNTLAINSLTVKLQYSDSSEMPCAGLCTYWYDGSQIQNPISYVFGEELIGNLTITVKYQGFETTFDVQVVGYEITFNANGGSGVMAGDERVGEYTLPTCNFTAPSGKQFKGWATSASGEVVGATYTLTANVEFFAIWEDIPHNHSYGSAWEKDANNHWNECACGDKANEGAHVDANTDGTCDTCGWVDPNFTPIVSGPGGGEGTPAPTPDNTPDTTPEVEGEEEAGLSGGAIAGIAVGATAGAVGLGAGGFAIFWFVVKKKSLAELLAIFKKAPKVPSNATPDIPTGNDDIAE